jgi:hypothetical protein
MRAENPCYTVITSKGSEASRKARFNWKQASLWAFITLGLVFLVAMADKIRSELPELAGPSELPNTLLYALGQALQTRPWNVAGIAALFILWLFLQILDRRLGDYRPDQGPPRDYWAHSVTWIAIFLFMVGWEIYKLMTPSTSRVPRDWFLWVYLVLALIVDYSVWVVALDPGRPKLDRLNWRGLNLATVAVAVLILALVETFQGKSSAWQWLLLALLLLASTASILVSHFGDFPAPKKCRWIRWLALGAYAASIFVYYFTLQMVDADDRVSGFLEGLLLITASISAIALIADSALRFSSRRGRHRIDEINYRYRRRR